MGSTPKILAIPITKRNVNTPYITRDLFGLYSSLRSIRTIQRAKTISTTILKAKALVVINGKNSEEETKNGIKGIRKRPAKIAFLNVCLFIGTIVTWSQYMKKIRQKAYSALRNTEYMFKTDMVYLYKSSFWTTLRFVIGLITSLGTMVAFGNLLPKEIYGVYSYLLSLAGSLGFLTLSGMSTGIIRAVARGKESIYPYAVRLQTKFNLLGTASIASLGFYYGVKGNMTFALSLLLLAIAMPVSAIYHSFESVLIGKKRFDLLTIITSIMSGVSAVGTIVSLFFTNNIVLIILTYSALSLIPNYVAYKYVLRDMNIDQPSNDDIQELKRTAFHLTGAGIVSTIAQYFDKIVLFQVAGPGALAIYGFAISGPERLKGLVKNWISIALPKLSDRSIDDINSVFNRRIVLATLMGLGLALFYIIFSPLLFKWFLPQYLDSIIYSQVYALGLIAIPISNFIGYAFYGQNMLRAVYINSIGSQLLRIALFLLLGWKWQIWGLIVASIFSYFASAIYSIIVWKYESARINSLNK